MYCYFNSHRNEFEQDHHPSDNGADLIFQSVTTHFSELNFQPELH